MKQAMAMVLSDKTQVGFTIATFVVILISVLGFGMRLGSINTEMSYMKEDIREIKKNQIAMDTILVAVDKIYQKKN